jgi:hypothetical protein
MKRACSSGVSCVDIRPYSEKPADYRVTAAKGRNMERCCFLPVARIHGMILGNKLLD